MYNVQDSDAVMTGIFQSLQGAVCFCFALNNKPIWGLGPSQSV